VPSNLLAVPIEADDHQFAGTELVTQVDFGAPGWFRDLRRTLAVEENFDGVGRRVERFVELDVDLNRSGDESQVQQYGSDHG